MVGNMKESRAMKNEFSIDYRDCNFTFKERNDSSPARNGAFPVKLKTIVQVVKNDCN